MLPDLIFKVVMIGDTSVGKTSIASMLTHSKFHSVTDMTIGVDFCTWRTVIPYHNGKDYHIKMHIWDTAGHERFRSITRSYFRNVSGCLMVYSIDSPSSVESLRSWHDTLIEMNTPDVCIVLVGNKSDLAGDGTIHEKAQEYAMEKNLPLILVSAKTGEGVHTAFNLLAQQIYDRFVLPVLSDGLPLSARVSLVNAATSITLASGVSLLHHQQTPDRLSVKSCVC